MYTIAILWNIFILGSGTLWFFGYNETFNKWVIYFYLYLAPICLVLIHLVQQTYIDLISVSSSEKEYLLDNVFVDLFKYKEAVDLYIESYSILNKTPFYVTILNYLFFIGYCFLAGALYLKVCYASMFFLLLIQFYKLNVWDLRNTVKKLYKGKEDPRWLLEKKT
jgi:hypothetical protein